MRLKLDGGAPKPGAPGTFAPVPVPPSMTPSRPPRSSPNEPKRRVSERRRDERRRSVQATDESINARMRGRQYLGVMRSLPYASAAGLLNTVVIGLASPGALPNLMVALWMAAVIALTLVHLQAWQQWRQKKRSEVATQQQLKALTFHAAGAGLLWGGVPLVLVDQVGSTQQTLLMMSLAGMLCTGALSLATLPPAAWTFMGAISAGSLLAFIASPQMIYAIGAVQWVATAAIAVGVGAALTRSLHARVSAEVKSEHQNQLIGLLMRDFAEQGSDVLWEIDGSGRLRQVADVRDLHAVDPRRVDAAHLRRRPRGSVRERGRGAVFATRRADAEAHPHGGRHAGPADARKRHVHGAVLRHGERIEAAAAHAHRGVELFRGGRRGHGGGGRGVGSRGRRLRLVARSEHDEGDEGGEGPVCHHAEPRSVAWRRQNRRK